MIRFLRNLLLVPIGAVLLALAVANRHAVPVSLNPFNPQDPGLSFSIPVFWLLFGAVALGVLIGGSAAWAKQGKYRKEARTNKREVKKLKSEADHLREVATTGPAHTALPGPDSKAA